MGVLVAKKKADVQGDGPKRERATAPIQVEKRLARMIAVIATHDGVTQSELISPVLKQFAEANYKRVVRAMGTEVEELDGLIPRAGNREMPTFLVAGAGIEPATRRL